MVIWLIGMSASGKTTLGTRVHRMLKRKHPCTVFLDGDIIREIMGNDLGHTVEDRYKNAQRISRLCYHLEKQGIPVVCAVLSIFHDCQRWNRENFDDYKEVYIEASMETLRRRELKGLYKGALEGKIDNVVGVDIPFPPPYAPDVVFNNDEDGIDLDEAARSILQQLGIDPS